MAETPKVITRSSVRISFLVIIALLVVGLGYVSYRGDVRDRRHEEVILTNCISLKNNNLAMIKLHEDIASEISQRSGRPQSQAILADIAELHRLIPNCEAL